MVSGELFLPMNRVASVGRLNPLTAEHTGGFTHRDIPAADFHYHRNMKLRNYISQDWSVSHLTKTPFFLFPARSAEDVHDTLWGFHFTVPSLNSSQWSGECPGEVDNFSIGIVLFTSAGMWRCICISFLLVSHSVGLHRRTVRWGQRSEPTMRSAPLRKGRIKEVYVFETVPHGNSTLWWRAKKIWVPIFLLISGKIWIPLSHLNSALLLLLFCIRVALIEWGSEKLGRTVNTPVIISTQTSSSGGFNYQSGASDQHHWAQGSK